MNKLYLFTKNQMQMDQVVKEMEIYISGTEELVSQCGTLETLQNWPSDAKLTKDALNKDRHALYFIHNVNPLLMHIENCTHILFGRKMNEAASFLNTVLNDSSRDLVIPEMDPVDMLHLEERVKMYECAIRVILKIRENMKKPDKKEVGKVWGIYKWLGM
eukprot:TRINITY_DN11603_c0_g1_i1.p1 TRINITY_DN11603_c0_g1~~TRINITY_DN11603_c0_g1_i1.p1  ORF type:complete len:160 (-),score=27.85 TRINITY_DN11603_c0_g1_i1:5-484(-)